MRALLTSFGSTGDAQPFLALATELRRSGHQPLLALSPYFAERVQRLGFAFAPIGAEADPDILRRVGAAQMTMSTPAEQVKYFLEMTLPFVPVMFRDLQALCREADVLISTPFQFAARMAHETTGLPLVSIHLSQFGAFGGKALREVSAPPINQCRAQAGLPPLPDPLGADGASPQLALYAVSRKVFRPPARWPAHHYVTGYFFLDEETGEPDPALQEFLEAGEPPVVVTFGSVAHPSAEAAALTQLVLAAIQQAGCRAILQRGISGLGQGPLPDATRVHTIGFASHHWLFPRAACVVHHGGAGTTAAAFQAGVPTVVVPHTLDQPLWAEFARAFGCAGAVIPYGRLTAENLGAAISKTLTEPRHRQAAAAFGEQIRAEHGVQTARELIERLLISLN